MILNLYIIAFGIKEAGATCWAITQWLEVFFGIEILLKFFQSFKDPETLMTVTSLKSIAHNYIINGTFLTDLVSFFPT